MGDEFDEMAVQVLNDLFLAGVQVGTTPAGGFFLDAPRGRALLAAALRRAHSEGVAEGKAEEETK